MQKVLHCLFQKHIFYHNGERKKGPNKKNKPKSRKMHRVCGKTEFGGCEWVFCRNFLDNL